MNACRHVQKIRLSSDHSVLNSQKWKCAVCACIENVWACLSCSHVACGKYVDEHIKQHYNATKHPLSMNVWEKYVYCYDCNEYILNDNAAGDIKILRSCLQAISSQKEHLKCNSNQSHSPSSPPASQQLPPCRRSSRVQRSSTSSIVSMLQMSSRCFVFDNNEEVAYTELWFRRYYLLAHFFNKWKMRSTNLQQVTSANEEQDCKEIIDDEEIRTSGKRLRSPSLDRPCSSKRRKHSVPGAVGLQNLGNTCYMNSILQVLKHLSQFSKVFLEENDAPDQSSTSKCTIAPAYLEDQNIQPTENLTAVALQSPHILGTYDSSKCLFSSEAPMTLDLLCDTPPSEDMQPIIDVAPQVTALDDTRASVAGETPEFSTSSQEASSCLEDVSHSSNTGSYNNCSSISTIEKPYVNSTKTTKYARKRTPTKLSLSHELNSLLRIMWSGKMTMVSPHKMLYAVWNIIPFFRGYSQQDAQEFLSEFLDKVQSEMDIESMKNSGDKVKLKNNRVMDISKGNQRAGEDIVTQLFQGELISQVKCLTCGYESKRKEAFMDLSLEFPIRFHKRIGSNKTKSFCELEEMLRQFMQVEKLDGRIYACEDCNGDPNNTSGETKYSEAEKRFLISKLPNVLRLHLKRFMWSGRSSKGKITVNVAFPNHLDISEFCHPDLVTDSFTYSLSAVVMHHGRGFGSGHYTAYCWNNDAESWLHCNDAKMQKATLEDVQKAQAYILVYTKLFPLLTTIDDVASLSDSGANVSECSTTINDLERTNGKVGRKSMIPKFADATRRLRVENLGFYSIKRTKTTIW